MAGLSVKLRKLDFSFNYAHRTRPTRILPGYPISQSFILIGMTYTPGWLQR